MIPVIILRLKEFKANIMMTIVMILMGIVFTAIFGNAFGSEYKPPIGMMESTDLNIVSQGLENLNQYDITYYKDFNRGQSALQNNRIFALITIDEQSKQVKLIKTKDVMEVNQLKLDLSDMLKVDDHKNTLKESLSELLIEKDLENYNSTFESIYTSAQDKVAGLPTFKAIQKFETKGSNFSMLLHSLVGFTLFFVTFPIVFNMSSILEDKQTQSFNRILCSPIKKSSYLFANMIVTVFAAVVQVIIMILAGKYLFNIDLGNHLGRVIAIYIMFIITMTCVGLALSSIVKNTGQLNAVVPLFLTSSAMLGGCMWPLEIVSNKVLLGIANITPHKWALSTIKDIVSNGFDPKTFYLAIVVMAVISVITFMTGLRTMRSYR